ncbi:MAG: formyltransferase family protein [Myxococcaceae bacterium]
MTKSRNFSTCYLIGDGSLPVACSHTLRRHGIHVSGILPMGSTFHKWGQANGVKVFPSLDAFNKTASAVDYIFSLGNPIILPEKTLFFAKKNCVNYHDGPLPNYSGVNVPMWAILNGEERHGITWHVMNKTVDTGDILLQRFIELSPTDTTTTLNKKCYQEALNSFEDLVDGIVNSNIVPVRQDLSKRRYYPLHTKLFENSLVDWNSTAEKIDRFCRALSFVDHLGIDRSAKVNLYNENYTIGKYFITNNKSTLEPGTLTRAQESFGVDIATQSFDIRILSVKKNDGEIVST